MCAVKDLIMTKPLPFAVLADTFEELEHTSGNTAMTAILARLFSRVSPKEARMAAYLLRGRVGPDFEGGELGMGEKFVVRPVAAASDVSPAKVEAAFRKTGDLGDAATVLAGNRRGSNLSLRGIVEGLKTIADTTGAGAQENKIGLLEDLLKHCAGVETKYVVRIVLGKLRLGIGEMIFLAGLSRAISAPAVCSGLNELKTAQPLIGKPIRMMLVQRIRDLAEASAHIRGALFVEYKYDGERAQAHVSKGRVVLYSRRL
jgi:DNA ligase-1